MSAFAFGRLGCCGKPHGCTNISEACTFRDHKWKRLYVEGHPLAYPPDAPEREGMSAPIPTWDVLRLMDRLKETR